MAARRHPLLATCMFGSGALLFVAATLVSPPLSTVLLLAGGAILLASLVTLIIWRLI